MGQYHFSELAMTSVTRELANRCLGPDGLSLAIDNDTCPGGCRTEVLRDSSNPTERLLQPIMMLFANPYRQTRSAHAS